MNAKKFFMAALFLATSTVCFSQLPPEPNPGNDPLSLTPGDGNNDNGGLLFPKTPILIPEVYLNGNVLTFDEAIEGSTVQLWDEDDTIVFSDFIEENQTSIVFPTTLFGSYKLLIVCSDITFYCEIGL